jgi:hypothetical protein
VSLYLYGIAGTGPLEALGRGLAGEPLCRIERGTVCAVAGEMDAPLRPDPAALAAHDAVVRRLAGSLPALLPARFGQSLPDEQAVSEWLAAHGPELAEALTLVAGCVQMTLRVYGDPVASLPPEPPNPETAGPGTPGTRYLAQRRREAERKRSLPEIAPLREALRPLLKAERIERPAAPGRLHATAYDLIARAAAGDYTRLVAEAAPALPGWHVTASGPWPPYAFAPGPVR